ncbi:MAG: hypothetical protein FJW32_03815 [Acidobacteria bacterium]|nr:hypothetical protein [Acidobacteriota bacterium]
MLKNVTFSVENEVLDSAREAARRQNSTLNELVRGWIADYARGSKRSHIEDLFDSLGHLSAGGQKFTREEMNERR